MKKILAIIICILIVFSLCISVHAEEATDIQTSEDRDEPDTISTFFKEWILPYIDGIAVIITLIVSSVCQIIKNKTLNKSIGTMNNNTVAISEQSAEMMNKALIVMENVANAVTAYDEKISELLSVHNATAEDKERIKKELSEMRAYLKTSAEANIEFANELAELLGLANIPNYKKEEIGSRHLSAVRSIRTAEHEALNAVKEDNNG